LGDTDQQVGKEAGHGIPTATPGINQYSPLDRLTPAPQKKNKTVNKACKSRQLTVGSHKPLPEIGQIVTHKACFLNQPPGETMKELLLKYQHQDWMLKE
jgi:hypothetical protein